MRTFTYDVECYRNYFLVAFEDVETREVFRFELREKDIRFEREVRVEIHKLMCNSTFVGYNSSKYDILMVWAALCGKTTNELKNISDDIIHNYHTPWNFCQNLGLKDIHQYDNHIDLMPLVKLGPSLKTCAGRLFAPKMQDLPYDPHVILTSEQQDFVRDYNMNDLDVTRRLLLRLRGEIKLRGDMSSEYGLDLRSKSDAQIAEAVIKIELERARGSRIYKPDFDEDYKFQYNPPGYLKFKTPELQDILSKLKTHVFELEPTGAVKLPDFVTEPLDLFGNKFQMGIGGLHSQEKSITHSSDSTIQLMDVDVSSYYPALILNSGIFPKHLGDLFLKVYRGIRDRRLQAKEKIDINYEKGNSSAAEEWKVISDSLKIVLNGTFGKLGSMFSIFYSVDLMIHVTLTGQLTLLYQIEKTYNQGFKSVSANTDGVVYKVEISQVDALRKLLKEWEVETGFDLEETQYKHLASRDVNNYFAVKPNGNVKVKGYYDYNDSRIDIDHNPKWAICVKAVKEHLAKGTSIEQTILQCDDIRQFVKVVNVKGGGVVVHKKPQSIPPHNSPEELVLNNGWEEYIEEKVVPEKTLKSGKIKPESIKTVIKYTHPKYDHPDSYNQGYGPCGIKKAYRLVQDEFLGNTEFGNYLGKVVRFYKAKDWDSFIAYKLSGNKVPESENSKQLMDMDGTLPSDLDKSWYIDNAFKILDEIGFTKQPEVEEVLSYEDFMKLTTPKRRIDVLEFAI